MLSILARRLAAAFCLAASFLASPSALAQAQRWSVLAPPGVTLGVNSSYRHFAAADSAGNLFLVGKRWDAGNYCFVTLKYTGDGALAWQREICTSLPGTVGTAIAVDAAGNVFVTGTVAVCCQVGFDRPADIRTLKYRGSDGAVLWDRSWNTSTSTPTPNAAYALALDPSGNPYVVGTSYVGSRFRLKAIKRSGSSGDISWETLFEGNGNYEVVGAGVAPNGDLIVGANLGGLTETHPEVFGFSATGGFIAWRTLAGTDETMTAFTVDPFGSAVTALHVVDPGTLADRVRIRKYGATGTASWTRDYASAGNDDAPGIASDVAGNLVVAVRLGGIYDLLRYTRDGQLLFESTYSTEGRPAGAVGVAFDPEGNILSTGSEETSAGRFMRVAKQDSTLGTVRWQARIGSGGSTTESGIAVVPAGSRVYAIGMSSAPNSDPTFRIVNFSNSESGTGVNVQGLWWNAAQSGWGVNLVQQGDKLFATWFAYDTDGQGMWLVMSDGVPSGTNAWSGQVHRTTGPAFFNFNASTAPQVSYALVGTATFTFNDANTGYMTTTFNGVGRSNNITRFQFGPMPSCALGASPGTSPNYTDIWWRPGESGWGVSLTHQGDVIFALWYTYASDSRGLWLVGSKLDKVGDRLYSGSLYRTTGTPYAASTWQTPQYQPMGSVTLNFTDAGNAIMDYTVGGITQSKPITRYVFASPVTVCK